MGFRGEDRLVHRRLLWPLLCSLAAALSQACIFQPHISTTPPVSVSLPIETARVMEQRFDETGAKGQSFVLGLYGGTSDQPCLQLQPEGCEAGSGDASFSALLLSPAISSAEQDSSGGYDLSFDGGSEGSIVIGRSGATLFSSFAYSDASLIAPFGEPRFLLMASGEATVYSITDKGLVVGASMPSERLSGDSRDPTVALALPGAGYAALAWDKNLKSLVASFLDEDLGVAQSMRIDSIDPSQAQYSGASGNGRVEILCLDGKGGFSLSRADRVQGPATLSGLIPNKYQAGYDPSWAGDRFWLSDGYSFASLLAADGTVLVHQAPVGPSDGFGFAGLPDGGLLVFCPCEPRRDMNAASPPYSATKLQVWRYDKDFQLVWKSAWTPASPARILAAAGDASGASVFICQRS